MKLQIIATVSVGVLLFTGIVYPHDKCENSPTVKKVVVTKPIPKKPVVKKVAKITKPLTGLRTLANHKPVTYNCKY